MGLAVGDIDKIQQNALMDRYVLQVIPWDTGRFISTKTFGSFRKSVSGNFRLQVEQHFPQFLQKEDNQIYEDFLPTSVVPYDFKTAISGIFDRMVWISKFFCNFGSFSRNCSYHLVPFQYYGNLWLNGKSPTCCVCTPA